MIFFVNGLKKINAFFMLLMAIWFIDDIKMVESFLQRSQPQPERVAMEPFRPQSK